MNKNKGFTLIELLVVIAIIGILSSVVLASLSSARQKAKVAAVQSTLSSMRAQAEVGATNGKYVLDICTKPSTSGGLKTLLDSIDPSKPNNPAKTTSGTLKCGQDTIVTAQPYRWAAEVAIKSGGTDIFYCADSTGYSGVSGTDGSVSKITTGLSSGSLSCK